MGLFQRVAAAFKSPPTNSVASRTYAGAMYGRLVSDWIASSTSMDSEVKASLRALRDRSRQLGRDNDYVKGFYLTVQDNVVGEGITFQAQCLMQRGGKLNSALNSEIELKWRRWAQKENCDVAGKLSFQDIERLLIRGVAESGEVFVRLHKQPFGKSRIPLGLQILEADQLGDDRNGRAENGNEIRMGVEINNFGRPVAYHFIDGSHPGDFQFANAGNTRRTVRIPASEIIHLGVFERPNQTRCVPWLAQAIKRLHQVGGYEEAEVVAARASAALMGFIENPDGELTGDGVQNGERVVDFDPGTIKRLGPGERMNVPDLHRPGGQLDPFMRVMLRGVATGVGVSYATLSRDYSQSNFSSSRMDLLSERDHWRVIQAWFIRNFHQAVFAAWLEMSYLSGELELPQYATAPEQYEEVKWNRRGWAWIDPLKDVEASKEAIKAGITTTTAVCNERGHDVEDVFAERRRELDLAKEHKLTFDTDPDAYKPKDNVIQGNFGGKKPPKDEAETDTEK